jgi:hypothetical protein
MPKIIGIDPGTEHSAYVVYDATNHKVVDHADLGNEEFLLRLSNLCRKDDEISHAAIEMISSYGMAVGKTTFDTIVWIGRMVQIIHTLRMDRDKAKPLQWRLCYRKQITKVVSAGGTAKDGNVRQALLDMFPATGGGATPQVGTKKQPGPLYGISGHKWQALAVAVYANEAQGVWNQIPPTTKG